MKKFAIILIIFFIFLAKPASASFFPFFNFFVHVVSYDASYESDIVEVEEPLLISDRDLADLKYNNWKDAYNGKDINKIFEDERNFSLSEDELNYLIEERLGDMDYPPVDNIEIIIEDDLIKLKGDSLKKLFKGDFALDARIVYKDGQANFEVTRVNFKGVPFPTDLASKLLNKELMETREFLYSHEEYKNLEITIERDLLSLSYTKS